MYSQQQETTGSQSGAAQHDWFLLVNALVFSGAKEREGGDLSEAFACDREAVLLLGNLTEEQKEGRNDEYAQAWMLAHLGLMNSYLSRGDRDGTIVCLVTAALCPVRTLDVRGRRAFLRVLDLLKKAELVTSDVVDELKHADALIKSAVNEYGEVDQRTLASARSFESRWDELMPEEVFRGILTRWYGQSPDEALRNMLIQAGFIAGPSAAAEQEGADVASSSVTSSAATGMPEMASMGGGAEPVPATELTAATAAPSQRRSGGSGGGGALPETDSAPRSSSS